MATVNYNNGYTTINCDGNFWVVKIIQPAAGKLAKFLGGYISVGSGAPRIVRLQILLRCQSKDKERVLQSFENSGTGPFTIYLGNLGIDTISSGGGERSWILSNDVYIYMKASITGGGTENVYWEEYWVETD